MNFFAMIRRLLFILFPVLLISTSAFGQTATHLKEINKIWDKFCLAFESQNYQLMAEIHSKELVRIGGGSNISDYEKYIGNYKRQFENEKKTGTTSHIGLRFFERANNDKVASERGIYELIRNKGTDQEQRFYGQFHVLFKRENGNWRIVMDYDSNEKDTIGKEAYLAAQPMADIDYFAKE